MRLTIGFEGYPFKDTKNYGPDVFMRRLGESIAAQKLATLTSIKKPSYDIALFKITAKNDYDLPFVLRNGGMYFDSQNRLGDSDVLNAPIFTSIDRAEGLVFISDFARQLVETFFRKLTIPYAIIHNAVNIQHFKPEGDNYRDRLHFARDDVVIVTAAKWRRWKRLQETVIVFKKLRTQFPERTYKLLVLGEHPDYVIKDKDIIYAGEIPSEKLPAWYRTGDLYLHLATLEICGNTQMEAIACGLPVICTNNGGIGETVRAANAGIVSRADPEFSFEKIDHYNPLPPDYDTLLADISTILSNYNFYKDNMNYEAVSIDKAAQKYVRFMEEVFSRYLRKRRKRFPYLMYRFEQSLKKLQRVPSGMKSRLLKRLNTWAK